MIRTVFKNFVSPRATRPYPIEVRPAFEHTRGELENDVSGCTFCGVCAKKCPSACITVNRKEKTWRLDPFSCVYCGICVDACPGECLFHTTDHKKVVLHKIPVVLTKEDPGLEKPEPGPA
ncbi:MAG: 4Fe-4S binding protein [Desulfarculaceae bacterium]|nr:4Fe-4S binding protein [Desulfarculaceae bacterium]